VLVRRTLADAHAHTLCGNCAAILGRRRLSLDALCAEVGPRPADRRQADRREGFGGRRRSGPAWVGAPVVIEDRRSARSPGRRTGD
jgi:hypothetical protein